MSDVTNYLTHAELALAAYANLNTGEVSQSALLQSGMALTQAQRFSEKWRVVDQFTSSNGLSATVFEKVANPAEKYLAIRGTDDAIDIASDLIDVAIFGTPEHQGQYLSLKSKVGEWLENGKLPS